MSALLSVVVPVYNEERVAAEFHKRLSAVLDGLNISGIASEIVYVNDGSRDKTLDILRHLLKNDPRMAIVDLSRNFGKEHAMTAGIAKAAGDAVIVIDTDLQDPPELIPQMLEKWREGYDVVLMKRSRRRGETFLKKFTAVMFYKFMKKIGYISIPENVGDFRLMSRKVVTALQGCPEETRFMKGLFAWLGFRTATIEYEREPRTAGRSAFNYWKLWNFAWDGLTSFSTAPLRLPTYIGLPLLLFGLPYAAVHFLVQREPGTNAALIACVSVASGLQLLALGIMGEYVSRIAIESKRRPLYIIDEFYRSETGGEPRGKEA